MKASFDATGEVVVVTGGARGIGAALAAAVARLGGTAVVFDVHAPEPKPVGDSAPSTEPNPIGNAAPGSEPKSGGDAAGRVEYVEVDVADRDAVGKAVAGVIERHGRIDGLVAGAAIQPRNPVLSTDPEEWTGVLNVNLDGVVWTCQAVVPHMIERRSGSVVVFTSGLAQTGYPGAAAYAASKAALTAFAKTLAAEVAEHRVRVNVIAPGVVDTDQFRAANPGADLDHWRSTTGVGDPDDVVGPLLFLLSDAAGMTGSQLTRERAFGRLTDF
ncbi:SDR family NAD(P)-dependent oxidoreductase [Kribbella deserti]|uniref:SDR family NAD(P)-dependent oxidoreductase n=1 Tax=Kribbella deserti TaxID=1926257 RepID=A0ABV6QNG2_9ACTN